MNNYYIIGTKYGADNSGDVTPYLQDKGAISMGFLWETNLTKYYNNNLEKLDKILREKNEKPTTISQVKKFLSLQPNDIVAIKSTGSPMGTIARLEIVGYAVVVERNGIVYRHDPEEFPNGLGHLINVEFLEFGIKRTLQLGYGQTIHKIKKKDHIEKIFAEYSKVHQNSNVQKNNNGTRRKNIDESLVTISSSYIKKSIHNKIQQGVYDLLVKTHGEDKVKMEKNFVDIIVNSDNSTELIEIKPHNSATLCIREGIGQLLSYYHKNYSDRKNVSLTIIGNSEPDSEDKEFIKFIQKTLNIKFKYESWGKMESR